MSGVLVLVTGTGRSGTSTIAGTLHHLGIHVPGPYFGADETNPKGYFESRWSIRFHKALTKQARIHEFDSRPGAWARVQEAVTPQARAELVAFLREHSAEHDQIAVKDPRSAWTQRLWKEAAAEAGLEIRYLSMLRHPAEVVGSRTTYYANPSDEAARRRYEIFNVARWVNGSLVSERETRGSVRTFVRYTDLLEDWRPVLRRVASELGLRYAVDLDSPGPNAVDEFIDPDLRRHKVTWEDLDVHGELQEIAEGVWQDLMRLHDAAGTDAEASADLDRLAVQYERLFADASAIAHDATEEAKDDARVAAREKTVAELAEQAVPAPAGRLVTEAGGRELLRALGSRVRARLSR